MAELIYRAPDSNKVKHKCESELPATYASKDIPFGSIMLCSCGRRWRMGHMIGEPEVRRWRRHWRPMGRVKK